MKKLALAVAAAFAVTAYTGAAFTQEKTVRITGFGAKSGVVRSFGINSEAAMLAAADMINKQGGVKLADGSKAKMVVDFLDDRCTAEEGISVLRRIYGTDALVAVGPTCSNVAEPLFGILQKKVGDSGDSGLQMPVFTDVVNEKTHVWATAGVRLAQFDASYVDPFLPSIRPKAGGDWKQIERWKVKPSHYLIPVDEFVSATRPGLGALNREEFRALCDQAGGDKEKIIEALSR